MYMGLDIGTSGVKAALVDGQGNIIRQHQVSYGFPTPQAAGGN